MFETLRAVQYRVVSVGLRVDPILVSNGGGWKNLGGHWRPLPLHGTAAHVGTNKGRKNIHVQKSVRVHMVLLSYRVTT